MDREDNPPCPNKLFFANSYNLNRLVSNSWKEGLYMASEKRRYPSINRINKDGVIVNVSGGIDEFTSVIPTFRTKIIYVDITLFTNPGVPKSGDALGRLLYTISKTPASFKRIYKGFKFIFCNGEINAKTTKSFVLNVDKYRSTEFDTICRLIRELAGKDSKSLVGPSSGTKIQPVLQVQDQEQEEQDILDGEKEELLKKIKQAAELAETEEEALDILEDDEYVKKILLDLEAEADDGPKMSVTRTSRMAKINDEFLNSKVNGDISVKDIVNGSNKKKELPPSDMRVDGINKEQWKDVRFINFEKTYSLHEDILKCINTLPNKQYPIAVRSVNVEDISNSQDFLYTYKIETEDFSGKRATLTVDLPKFKNERFMRLRGNDKIMSGQFLLLPCTKSDSDTVQLVSFYNKIFIRRKGQLKKSYPSSDRLIKALRKIDSGKANIKGMKIYFGDNTKISTKYELPVDYIDLTSTLNRIETSRHTYYFDQDIYRTKFSCDSKKGIPFAVDKQTKEIIYYQDGDMIPNLDKLYANMGQRIAYALAMDCPDFLDLYNSMKVSNTLNYSEASVLASKIPLIVLLGLSLGFSEVLKRANIKFKFIDKKSSNIDLDMHSLIPFADGYLRYEVNYSSSMLLNGLSKCDTENYDFADMEKKSTWLDFLDNFGGRILSDGLDNFRESFLDPITQEICKDCRLPTDYFNLLIYANNMLADNKYIKHTDISGNRFRSNEQIAQLFYKCLCNAYESYKLQTKRGRKVAITMKRSVVIDAILLNSTTSDLSILNPLLELEAANSISFKGPSGMNSDRAYGLDKRCYDDSMLNKVALSNSFAANIGISRWATMDMDIQGDRGYIKKSGIDEMSVTKSLCVTEAITPFGINRDDPFRTAMTFIQTSKHSMRTKKSMPLLISNGTDEAMPYMSSDTYCYRAKESGVVKEITKEYMCISYDKPVNGYMGEYIDLRDSVKKCSDGGFYITIKLDTDLKVEDKFKKNDIIAYDKLSYANKNGEDDNIAYNLGTMAKVAILNTDEGFEDSTSISNWLSEAMETEVVTMKDLSLSKNCNVYEMVMVGQRVQEGDSLITFQNSFEEKDANLLLKSITDTDYVSDLGRQRIKAKYTGVVQDIKIYRTCELSEMSDSLRKIVENYENGIKKVKKVYQKYNASGMEALDPDTKVSQTGKTKNVSDGVLIEFYIMYNDKLGVGDKIVAQSANKGVVKYIFPKGMEPFSVNRPDESIHALFAARSFNARKVTSVWSSGALNKVLIELDRKIKDILNIPQIPIEDIQ